MAATNASFSVNHEEQLQSLSMYAVYVNVLYFTGIHISDLHTGFAFEQLRSTSLFCASVYIVFRCFPWCTSIASDTFAAFFGQ